CVGDAWREVTTKTSQYSNEEPRVFHKDRPVMFSGGFFRGELGNLTKAGALDFRLRRSEHAELYSKWVESSAGFLILVTVLGYEPECSFIGWRSICLSVQFPRLSEDSISPSPPRQPLDSPSQLFSANLEHRGHV